MKFTRFLLFALALAALTLTACSPALITNGGAPATRSLTVTGAGQATLTPDIAYISIGVHTESSTAASAMSDNNAQAQAVIEALRAAGVKPEDIRTTNFSIWATPQYSPDGQATGQTVYAVDNTVYVTVRDLAGLGSLLDKAVQAGANNISNIQFDVADKTKAMSEARNTAVESAKAQAQELASAAGVSLGNLQTISYYDSAPAPVFEARALNSAGVGGGAPINPGTLQITVSVTLTYEIK